MMFLCLDQGSQRASISKAGVSEAPEQGKRPGWAVLQGSLPGIQTRELDEWDSDAAGESDGTESSVSEGQVENGEDNDEDEINSSNPDDDSGSDEGW